MKNDSGVRIDVANWNPRKGREESKRERNVRDDRDEITTT